MNLQFFLCHMCDCCIVQCNSCGVCDLHSVRWSVLYIRAGSRRSSLASLPGFAGYFHCFTSLNMLRRWTHNCLVFTKLRLLKDLKKTLDGGNLVLNDTVLAPSGSNKISHKNIPKVTLNSHLQIEAFTKMFFCIFYQGVFLWKMRRRWVSHSSNMAFIMISVTIEKRDTNIIIWTLSFTLNNTKDG